MSTPKPELRVYFCTRETNCSECEILIDRNDFLFIRGGSHLCLSCADLDHLIYLPSGDAALTRRASKHSKLVAKVYSFSSARKRNERQGILVEKDALEIAEDECLADENKRAKQRERDTIRRANEDIQYKNDYAQKIRELYPSCPKGREVVIAEHACQKYSGRVGRSASAKQLEKSAIYSSVIAHIRHCETNYDHLLMQGYDRDDARQMVKDEIETVMSNWRTKQ